MNGYWPPKLSEKLPDSIKKDRPQAWLYVGAVIYLFSRRVVGWSMNANVTAQLVTDALTMAIWCRGKLEAVPHHSEGKPTHERAVPARRLRYRLLNEPRWKCLRQRRNESFFSSLRTERRAKGLSHEERRQGGCVRLHRALLQSEAPPFDNGLSQPQL